MGGGWNAWIKEIVKQASISLHEQIPLGPEPEVVSQTNAECQEKAQDSKERDKCKENHESPGVSTYSGMIKERAHGVLIVKEIAFLFSEAHKSKGSNNLEYALVERFLDKIFLLATVARFAATTKRVFVHWYSLC
jgi:hypothetical protein